VLPHPLPAQSALGHGIHQEGSRHHHQPPVNPTGLRDQA
jgi:hypothetical protein